jgi:hypothetical protein
MPFKDPERARAYQREYRRLRRAADVHPGTTVIPLPVRLKTAQDVLALLEEQIGALRVAQVLTASDRARTIGYLASIALKAIEQGDLSARMEALEAALKLRRNG